MTAIVWAEIDSSTFEKMVSALIKSKYPDAQRIDGSGGDQGREIQITTGDGLVVYQFKSFTGRVDDRSGRRRQVEHSLVKAAKLNPASWTLVVPIDPTPGELAWFERLRQKYPFPLDWSGKNWLDLELSERPGLVRYFLHNGADEAVRLLTQLKAERAALGNAVPDALKRAQDLMTLLNDVDPYYTFEITMGTGKQAVAVIPRYPGAEADSPIRISLELQVPDSPEGRARMVEFRSAFEYGTGMEISSDELRGISIEAPAGMGGKFTSGKVIATPVHDPNWKLPGRLLVVTPDGTTVAALPVVYSERTTGSKGFTVTAWDRTGTLRVVQRVDGSTAMGVASIKFDLPEDAHPGLVLPVLRFLYRLSPPNMVVFEINGKTISSPSAALEKPLIDGDFFEIIEALDRVQAGTATPFAVPGDLNKDDVDAIVQADRLLKGEALELIWESLALTVSTQAGMDALLNEQPGPHRWMSVHPDYSVSIADHEVHLGQFYMTFPAVKVRDIEALRAAKPLRPGEERDVVLFPGESGEKAELRLGAGPDRDVGQ